MKRCRLPRPKTKHFPPEKLVELWTPLLDVRDPGYQWDGSTNWSGGSDKDDVAPAVQKCIVYRKPLESLARLADTGFPAHNDLLRTFVLVQKGWAAIESSNERVLNEVVVTWRSMAKTLYEVKKASSDSNPPPEEIKELVDRIVLPKADLGDEKDDSQSCASHEPLATLAAGKRQLSMPEVLAMFGQQSEDKPEDKSDNDVEITAVSCNCEKSKQSAAKKHKGNEGHGIAIPSCAKGGQRKETEKKRRKVQNQQRHHVAEYERRGRMPLRAARATKPPKRKTQRRQ